MWLTSIIIVKVKLERKFSLPIFKHKYKQLLEMKMTYRRGS